MNELSTNENSLEESKSVSKNIFNELFNPTLDLTIDYSEIYIDDFINNEALKEIPFVKSVVGVLKTGITINQFWFAKKLFTFIQEFNKGDIKSEEYNSFRIKLQTDTGFEKKVAEKLMVFIDKHVEITQTKITSNLFRAFVNQQITYQELSDILISLDKLHPKSYNGFFELEKINFVIDDKNNDLVERDYQLETLINNTGLGVETPQYFHGFELTNEGSKFFEFGLKPLIK